MIDAVLDVIIKDPKYAPIMDANGNLHATFCNLAVIRYLNEMANYHVFDCKMANEICAMLDQHTEWIRMEGLSAQVQVNAGHIGMAAHPYVHHGHVAIIAPEDPPHLVRSLSGRWAMMCPVVGNVGHKNGYMDSNMAFPSMDTPPSYYILDGKTKGT